MISSRKQKIYLVPPIKKRAMSYSITERWTPSCEEAFLALKQKLTSAPLLGYPDFHLPFILETDASLHGLGSVLSQMQGEKKVVIAYASRSLKLNERNMQNYSSMKLELLALRWAISQKFRDILIGCRV